MKSGTLTLVVLVVIGNPFFSAYGESCGLIDNWNEQDAKSLYSDYEDWGTIGPNEKRVYSSLVMSALKSVTNDYKWRLSIILHSFPDRASADAYYDEQKNDWHDRWSYSDFTIYPDNSNDLISMIPGPDNLGGDIGGDKAKRLFLMGKHLGTFIFYFSIWSTKPLDTEGLGISQLRSEALSIFEKAKIIIYSKCGKETTPPKISFYPYDPNGYLFELSILKDKGFLIEIEDEDGITNQAGNWKIDWSSLQILVEGQDITGHFLKTVNEQGLLEKASLINVGTTLQIMIKLDPAKLMAEHNFFAVPENGRTSVMLKICDTDGLCASTDHQVYFGPFSVLGGAEIGKASDGSWFSLKNYFIGNTGKSCQAEVYYLVLNEGSGKLWIFSGRISDDQYVWDGVEYQNQNDLKSFFVTSLLMTGTNASIDRIISPIISHQDWPDFGDGKLIFFIGVLDKSTNEWAFDSSPIKGLAETQ